MQTQSSQLCYIVKQEGDRYLYGDGNKWINDKEEAPLYVDDGTLLNRWGGTSEMPQLQQYEEAEQ